MKRIFTLLALALALATASHAGEGHDHDHDAPAAPSGPALPRFSAVSEAFELVGIVNGQHLALYLDRFADNAPVEGASLELEVAGRKLTVAARAPGEYEARLPEPLKPGVTPVTATVEANGETDMLAGDLEIQQQATPVSTASDWPRLAGWAAAALVAAALATFTVRRMKAHRKPGGAA